MCICDYVKNRIGTCKKCAFGLEKGYKWMNVELPTDLRLRILGNQKKSENCLIFIESYLIAQSPWQNESFVNSRRSLLKNKN